MANRSYRVKQVKLDELESLLTEQAGKYYELQNLVPVGDEFLCVFVTKN